jgi:hypothetical protein
MLRKSKKIRQKSKNQKFKKKKKTSGGATRTQLLTKFGEDTDNGC